MTTYNALQISYDNFKYVRKLSIPFSFDVTHAQNSDSVNDLETILEIKIYFPRSLYFYDNVSAKLSLLYFLSLP